MSKQAWGLIIGTAGVFFLALISIWVWVAKFQSRPPEEEKVVAPSKWPKPTVVPKREEPLSSFYIPRTQPVPVTIQPISEVIREPQSQAIPQPQPQQPEQELKEVYPLPATPPTVPAQKVQPKPPKISCQLIGHWGNGELDYPAGLAILSTGEKLVVDTNHNRVVKYNRSWQQIEHFGREGEKEGEFEAPWGIAASESAGKIYVTDLFNHRVQAFNLLGNFLFQFGGKGDEKGQFALPCGIAVTDKNVLVTDVPFSPYDTIHRRVQVFDLEGNFLYSFGNPNLFAFPEAIAVKSGEPGFIYIADFSAGIVSKFTLNGQRMVAQHLPQPTGIAVNSYVYVLEAKTKTIKVLNVNLDLLASTEPLPLVNPIHLEVMEGKGGAWAYVADGYYNSIFVFKLQMPYL